MEWGGNGEREVSLRATWDQSGWDRTTQKEGFQVSKRIQREEGISKGNWQRETSKGDNKELRHNLVCQSMYMYLNDCMNATNKECV